MSGLRALVERTLGGWLPSLSARRRDWVRAAIAELPDVPDGLVLGWSMGAAAIAIADLAEQSFLPWRRDKGSRPPAGLCALLGLIFLAAPIYFIAAILIWPGSSYGRVSELVSASGIGLCLWINLAALLRADSLGGLLYAVGVRKLPLNALAVLAAAVLAYLVSRGQLT
jgi:hypothetical protein